MKKVYVLVDEDSGIFFTGNENCWWNFDIANARTFYTPEDAELYICIKCDEDNHQANQPFDKIENMMLATIFRKK